MNKYILFALLMVVSLFATSANGGPMAYSVNSDGINDDNLYLIDLATGVDQFRGNLFTGIEDRTDTEGLAFSPGPNSRLWGIDDASGTLFPINPENGSIDYNEEIQLPLDFQSGGGNDFGMTFACDNSLFFTSVKSQTLYRRDPGGSIAMVGSAGSLGVNISAIAAFGNPTKLYGLGNGQYLNGETDSPNLYAIDLTTGIASFIGSLGSPGEFKYNQAGMSFDNVGGLWAITDRSQIDKQKSQILSINVGTGAATLIATTLNEVGYESLAISPQGNCDAPPVADAPPGARADDFPPIPSLSLLGRLSAILVLMLAGILILRRRYT
jgi:hypothetical protein